MATVIIKRAYVNYLEQKQTRNGKAYFTYQVSEQYGTDESGKKLYRYNHCKTWGTATIQNGDIINAMGEVYEEKWEDGKNHPVIIVDTIGIYKRSEPKREETSGRYEAEDYGNIPF